MAQRKNKRTDMLTLDIDLRMSHLWKELDEIEEWNMNVTAACMRAAYAAGYCDAIRDERAGTPQKLMVENKFKTI